MIQTTDLVHDYLAAWNETDPELRRAAIQRLYAADGRIVTASVDAYGIEDVLGHVDQVVTQFIGPEKSIKISAFFHHDSRRDKPSTDIARDMIRKVSFKPTGRRSFHLRTDRDLSTRHPDAGPSQPRSAEHLPR